MTNKLYFHAFLLSVVVSEWVEITKVANKESKQLASAKIVISTSPSYEEILIRPQYFTEISVTTPAQENANTGQGTSSLTPINSISITLQSKDSNEDNMLYKYSKIEENGNFTRQETIRSNVSKIDENLDPTQINDQPTFSDDDIIDDDVEDDYDYQKNITSDFPENISAGLTSVLRNVQKHLINYKENSLNEKITVLTDLRNNLLFEIKNRMSKLWLPVTENKNHKARGYKDFYLDDHYKMDFPSNEGALITIGFLTFAVFLIKLVLKLIYTLKNKQQYYFQPTTTTAASVFLKRSNHEITEDQFKQSIKIMQYIEEYPLS